MGRLRTGRPRGPRCTAAVGHGGNPAGPTPTAIGAWVSMLEMRLRAIRHPGGLQFPAALGHGANDDLCGWPLASAGDGKTWLAESVGGLLPDRSAHTPNTSDLPSLAGPSLD